MFRSKARSWGVFFLGLAIGVVAWQLPGKRLPPLFLYAGGLGWKCEYWGVLETGEPWKAYDIQADATLHFVDDANPVPDITSSFFSRLDGRLHIMETNRYQFISRARGGVRIWIDDQLILDAWRPVYEEYHLSRRDTVVELQSGVHRVRIETRHRHRPLARYKITFLREGDYTERPLAVPWVARP